VAGATHYPRSVATTVAASTATDFASVAANRFNDNEIERIEGILAAQYGVSHNLPCGFANSLKIAALPADGETVSFVPQSGPTETYVFKAAFSGTVGVREVLRGTTPVEAADNLCSAINGLGVPGTEYSDNITASTIVRATTRNVLSITSAQAIIKVETFDDKYVGCLETLAAAGSAWRFTNTDSLGTQVNGLTFENYIPGHYPHPFALQYGFPRKDTATQVGLEIESKGKMLTSKNGILARWDANGKIAWVATSRDAVRYPGLDTGLGYPSGASIAPITLPAASLHYGGIGWACAFGTDPDVDVVYSVGPMYTGASTAEEKAVIRRVIDNKTSCDLTGAGTWKQSTLDLHSNGSAEDLLNPRLRIDVDTFDNVYLPMKTTIVMSLMCIETYDLNGTLTPRVAWSWRAGSGTTNPAGLCVAVDKKVPVYDGDPATRALAVYLGTSMGYTVDDTAQDNLYRIEAVSVTHIFGVAPAETRLCAVVDGELWTSLGGSPFA
jgi:hypothetical protein